MTQGDRNLEKQIGCMAGFLQIFDRHQRIYAPKRIPSPPATGSTNSSSSDERSEMFPSSPENLAESPETAKISINAFDLKERLKSSWKLREGPRLSLDSRLRPRENADSDKNRRSPSIVARLMGLDALPDGGEPTRLVELRRSASESRVSRDMRRCVENDDIYTFQLANLASESKQSQSIPPPKRSQSQAIQRRSYFNAQEFFPEPNRKKGMDEDAKNLDSLKQILEALQLKGLLHSKPKISSKLLSNSPIVVMKLDPKPVRRSEHQRRRPTVEEKPVQSRSPRSPDPYRRRKPLINNVNLSSPKSSPRKMMPDPATDWSPRSPRIRERVSSPAEEDTAATLSEYSVTSSHFDLERSRAGQNLLERCGKLLDSIAAFTSAEQVPTGDQQPSPVSVLEASFPGEDNSPSPIKKRSMVFKDPFVVDWEDEVCWVPESHCSDYAYVSNAVLAYDRFPNSSSEVYSFLERRHGATREGAIHRQVLLDMVYEILDGKRHVSPWESFSHKQQWPMDRVDQAIRVVWEEVKRAREVVGEAEDLNEVTRKAIQGDMTLGEHAWVDTPAEMSDAVLCLERMVFKDLVGEMIRDFADLGSKKARNPLLRRKLLL